MVCGPVAGGHGLWPGLRLWLVARAPLAQAYRHGLWPGLWSWLVAGSQGSLGPDLWPWLVAKAQSYGHGQASEWRGTESVSVFFL